jgi:uncharacterized protein YcbK (DUF882 family)
MNEEETAEIWDELRFFKKSEFDCNCGCGLNKMDPEFLRKLEVARERAGFQFVITSGYRCPLYNQVVSATGENGPHTTGRAADVSAFGERAFNLVAMVPDLFTGIGLKQHGKHEARFIHLDDLEKKDNRARPTIWTY